jgi:hypothetical protein
MQWRTIQHLILQPHAVAYHPAPDSAAACTCDRLSNWINSMEHNPYSETNSCSANQEISHLLLNLKVHYRVHKCPPLDPILSYLNPFHSFTFYFSKINFNVILPSTTKSRKWSLLFRFSDRNFVYFHTKLMSLLSRRRQCDTIKLHPNTRCF